MLPLDDLLVVTSMVERFDGPHRRIIEQTRFPSAA